MNAKRALRQVLPEVVGTALPRDGVVAVLRLVVVRRVVDLGDEHVGDVHQAMYHLPVERLKLALSAAVALDGGLDPPVQPFLAFIGAA
jgi:hypothetical protein